MISKRASYILMLQMMAILLGIVSLFVIRNDKMHMIYIMFVSIVLVITVFSRQTALIRPISYLILSFFVFVWMRYLLNIFFDVPVISIGGGIITENINFVAIYLGISINIILIFAIVTKENLKVNKIALFESEHRILVPKIIQWVLLLGALIFFSIFLLDSVKKISIVNSSNYLAISETILIQGYKYFSLGKYLILLWAIFGTQKDRYFIASTIMMLASTGYLMRGARGYAIMYIFLWLLFLSFKKRIHFIPLVFMGIALVFLANFILSYRLGWSVASGFKNVIISTLNSQGSSIESVFGSVIFHDEIKMQFRLGELFTRNDYGIIVDKVRNTGFEMGGFGSSFFGEIYLGGPLFIFLFLIIVGICVGILEQAYDCIIASKSKCDYSRMLLFMTIPNLIYLGRSSIKDFIFKTIITVIIIVVIQSISTYRFYGKHRESCNDRQLCNTNFKL